MSRAPSSAVSRASSIRSNRSNVSSTRKSKKGKQVKSTFLFDFQIVLCWFNDVFTLLIMVILILISVNSLSNSRCFAVKLVSITIFIEWNLGTKHGKSGFL